MTTELNDKLFKNMTAEEQLKWATDFSQFADEKLPVLEQLGDTWEGSDVKSMREGLALMNAFSFCRDFVGKSLHYGDFSARVNRIRFYVELIKQKIAAGDGVKGVNGDMFAFVPKKGKTVSPRRGRPASAATIARREAEAKAAQQQTEMFGHQEINGSATVAEGAIATSAPRAALLQEVAKASEGSAGVATPPAAGIPFIAPNVRDDAEYKLSIAQKRAFLSPDLQRISDQIRALRTTAGAAAEKAKTMADLKASPDLIAPVAEEAQRTLEQVESIYAAIDMELAETWFRLENDEPYRQQWLARYKYKGYEDLHPDLVHDLRKHYKKVCESNPGFDVRMKKLIEQESPEFVARQKEEAARKKEVQDILRYFKRKDKSQKVETARTKFKRLEELLGKKEAAVYKPLLTKIEDDYKESLKQEKATKQKYKQK